MSKFWIEPLTDAANNRYWVLFEHGQFHAPTAVLDDSEAKTIARLILGEEMANIGEAIKKHRQFYRYSQQELAKIIGISRVYLADIEAGKANITMKTREKILKVVGGKNGNVS